MIFKLDFPKKTEYAQAKNIDHLREEYEKEYGNDSISMASINSVSDDEAKTIMLKDEDEDETFSLFDAVIGDYFLVVGSSDWH